MSDLTLAVKTLKARQGELEKAEKYYDGTQEEVFASPKLKRALSRTGSQFRINFARTPVEAVLNRLEILSVTASGDEAIEAIQKVWGENEMDLEADEIHRWALVFGDAYLIAWPNEDGTNIELTYNSPRLCEMFYDEEHPRRKKFAAKVWTEGEGKNELTRVNLYYPDRVEKYVSKTKKAETANDFTIYIDSYRIVEDGEEVYDDQGNRLEAGTEVPNWPLENPWGSIPVFHFRTRRPKGRPEHADAFGPQDMINKLVITQMATNDFHGFPQRYVLSGGSPSSEASDFDVDTDAAAETPSLKSGPGELWWLTGEDLNVGQFAAADAETFLSPLKVYIQAMSSVTDTPLHLFEGMGDVPSGESLRAAEAPLIKKVENRQQLFGATWSEVFKFVLTMFDIPEADVSVIWEPAASHDDKDSWEVAKTKSELGIPFRYILREQGYSDEEIDEIERLKQESMPPAAQPEPIMDEEMMIEDA